MVPPHPAGNKNLESLAYSFAGVMFPAIRQPENSQGEHPIDGRLALLGVDPDERPALLPAHQQASRIRGPKAVLQVHGRAQALHFVFVEVTAEQPLQQLQIPGPGEGASSGRPQVAIFDHLERLRALRTQAAHADAQRLFASFQAHHGADHIPLFRPQMQHAAAMLGRDRVMGCRHLEEHTAILKQGGARIVGKKLLQQTGEFRRRNFRLLADFQFALLPAHARRELGDVCGVVAAMPVVEDDRLFDRLTAVLRMRIAALPVLLIEG